MYVELTPVLMLFICLGIGAILFISYSLVEFGMWYWQYRGRKNGCT
jgi:hypothetical protein